MKTFYLTSILVASLYSAELIHVSNSIDSNTLLSLEKKYGQNIIVNGRRAYIAPQECIVDRYFGGISENNIELPKSSIYTAPITVTQEVFEAGSVEEIEEQIVQKKTIDKIEGKSAKAFLEDNAGHLYGGVSQLPIDLTEQKIVIKKDSSVKSLSKKKITAPACKLLNDGSGYIISNINNANLYKNGSIKSISNNTILFD